MDRILLKLPLGALNDTMGMDTTDIENTYRNSGIGKLLLNIEPLTEDEYNAFCAQRLDAIKLSRQNFCFDFTLRITNKFNKQAIHLAMRLFKVAVEGGEYNRTLRNGAQLPNEFLQPNVLLSMVESHAEYLFKMYNEAACDDPEGAKASCLERTNRNLKKNKVCAL